MDDRKLKKRPQKFPKKGVCGVNMTAKKEKRTRVGEAVKFGGKTEYIFKTRETFETGKEKKKKGGPPYLLGGTSFQNSSSMKSYQKGNKQKHQKGGIAHKRETCKAKTV